MKQQQTPPPPSSCHPVKTKTPSLSADDTLHKPNKALSKKHGALTDGAGTLEHVLYKGLDGAQTHTHTHIGMQPLCTEQLLPSTSAKPMFTFTNPPPRQKHSNVEQTACSWRTNAQTPAMVIPLRCAGLLISLFQNKWFVHANEKKNEGQWLPLLRLHFVNYCNRAQETPPIQDRPSEPPCLESLLSADGAYFAGRIHSEFFQFLWPR